MKTFLKIFASLIVLLLVGFYFFTQPLVNRAKDFFNVVNENNLTKTEEFFSTNFKKSIPKVAIANYLVSYGIYGSKDVVFGLDRRISLNLKEASLKGTLVNKDSSKSSIKVSFIKEDGKWQISSIEKVLTKAEKEKLAKEKKIYLSYLNLSRTTIHYLGSSVKDNNFTTLYNYISDKWKKETSSKELKKAYGVFHDKHIKLSLLDKLAPNLTYIKIDKDGYLTLKGFYLVGKQKVFFVQKYILEKKKWKLVGLSVTIK